MSEYVFVPGDGGAVLAHTRKLFGEELDPDLVALNLWELPAWKYVRPELQTVANRLLRLELDEDRTRPGSVSLGPDRMFTEPAAKVEAPTTEETKLWAEVLVSHPPSPLAAQVLDMMLTSGHDRSPAIADQAIQAYRDTAASSRTNLHATLAGLRANTIARSRSLAVESDIRADLLASARSTPIEEVPPGIAMRYIEALAVDPRTGSRPAGEIEELRRLLEEMGAAHSDPTTADAIARCRRSIALNAEERDTASRLHVAAYMATARAEPDGLLQMHWAGQAADLAEEYDLRAERDQAIVFMQKIPREEMGWKAIEFGLELPRSALRQHSRRAARLNSWEKAVSVFLASDSPTGDYEKNREISAKASRGSIRRIFGTTTFGAHGMPERSSTDFEETELRRLERLRLMTSGLLLSIELRAIRDRFDLPNEARLSSWLSTSYGSDVGATTTFAQALRFFWDDDYTSAARIAIPLIETCARELLLLLDAPLYRRERGQSPGRFPALDFYLDALDDHGLDVDWSRAIRNALLNPGMNLRNLYAHGFRLDFTSEEAAVLLRLVGMLVALPIRSDALVGERLDTPLTNPRRGLRRRPAWRWE